MLDVIIPIITTIVALGWAIYEHLMRKKDRRQRDLSEKVYEPLLDGINAVLHNEWDRPIGFSVWEEEKAASREALLKLDDTTLFNKFDEFREQINQFNSEFAKGAGKGPEECQRLGITNRIENLKNEIPKSAKTLLKLLEKKLKI